jgi:PAS domain S-box-containing protein
MSLSASNTVSVRDTVAVSEPLRIRLMGSDGMDGDVWESTIDAARMLLPRRTLLVEGSHRLPNILIGISRSRTCTPSSLQGKNSSVATILSKRSHQPHRLCRMSRTGTVDFPFLNGGGALGELIRDFHWSGTGVGPLDKWPSYMRTATSAMLRSMVPMVMLWGDDGVMIYNDAYARFAGGRHPQLLGANVREGWPEVADFNDNVMNVGLAGGTLGYRDQELILHRRGQAEAVWMDLDYSPLLDESGAPVGVMAIVVETTSKVLAERRLKGERENFARLFEQAPSFMAMLRGPQHLIELANPSYLRLIGDRPILGRTVAQALPEVASQGYIDLLDKVYSSGEAFAATSSKYVVRKSPDAPGIERFLDFVFQPIRDSEGTVTGIFVEGFDVTDRKDSEHALRETEAQLRALNADLERQVEERSHERGMFWQLTSDLLGVLNSEGYFEKSNPAWFAVLGWSEDEVRRTSIFELLHPDDVADTRGGFERLTLGTPAVNFVNRYRCKDGSYRWLSWMGVPEEGKYYCSGRDITLEKEAQLELNATQDALRQAQKMEAVGQLTGGLAHDFNNLLAGISASLQVLEARLSKGKLEGVERYLGMGRDSIRRAATLTQRLLAFSRRQTLDPKATDVNRLVIGMEELIRRTVGPSVKLEVVGAGGLWPTLVDPSQLESSLLNLCINARDAMPDGGRLTIETANKWLDERAAAQRELPPGQYISLCVTDTGTGMSPDVIARAFDPFFTTKPIGRGTGLGLSMVYGFVRQSGGQVRIYSELGQGTTMCLYFPRHAGEPGQEEDIQTRASSIRGDGEAVLVIEDEDTIRELILEVLLEAGYQVIVARDGPEGMRSLQSKIPVDLLVTDVGLPGGMNGRQVADAARLARPGLKVLFITGYAENAAVGNGHLDVGMEIITKPFEVAALTKKIRDMLDQ